ncbi:MAG: DMT family transporter [Opitutales bacterium]|nr:DMT family transporter [Opitutales bacterium]
MKSISLLHHTWLLAFGFVLLWNSGFIAAKYALPYAEPLTLLFWRYWLLAFILFGYLALRRRLEWPGTKAALIASLIGILAHGVWLGCVFYSLQYGVPAGIVALVVALQPMTTATFSGLVVGERTPLLRWAGLLIGLAGVMVAVLARTELTDAASVFAYFIPFGSVAAITAASLIQRRIEVKRDVHRMAVDLGLFYQSLGTALAVTIPAVLFEGLVTEWNPVFAGAMLWLILGVSLMAYALMWLLIVEIDATRVASLFYFGPPVTMVMAWVAFGDRLLPTDLAGLGIVAVGVVLTLLKTQARPAAAG